MAGKWNRRGVAALGLGALLSLGAGKGPGVAAAPPGAPEAADDGVIKVRVVSSATCSNTPLAIDLIRAVASEMGLQVEVTRQIAVTHEDAIRYRFFGSPTVQIDGLDLEAARRESDRYVLT